MDNFEKQFEDMDVRSAYVEGAMNQTTATATPQSEVDTLIMQVADEHGLEVSSMLDAQSASKYLLCLCVVMSRERPKGTEVDDLTARLVCNSVYCMTCRPN